MATVVGAESYTYIHYNSVGVKREELEFWIHAWGVDRQVRTYYATMYMYRERSTLTTEDNGKVSRNGEWSWVAE